MNLYHHSRDLQYRDPQGAVPCKTAVRLSVDCDLPARTRLGVMVSHANGSYLVPMERTGGRATAVIVTESMPQRMQYCFRVQDGDSILFYGAEGGVGTFGEMPRFYGLTVYDAGFTTPEWFRSSVVYQIYPDRFACSDPAAFCDRIEAYRKTGRAAEKMEWGAMPLYRPHGGNHEYAPDDYFGGDLAGIREKLPYLKDLGITALYLNPIFSAHSNHRYNTADYFCIDPILGTEEDFDRLAEEAKALGIRIILDGVFSHTGDDSIYFDRYGRYGTGACSQPDSPYRSWYRFSEYPNRYECWWGFDTLPNVEELDPSYTEFVQGENGVLRHWLRHGASGWRLDVADELPDRFIRGIRQSIKSLDPDAVLIGEVWDNCATKIGPEGRRGYVNGDLLDSAMNYPFRDATLAYLRGHIDAFGYAGWLQTIREDYPKPFYDACLNLLGSHDTGRLLTMLCGCPDPKSLSREQQADYVPDADALSRAKRLLLLATAIQMSLPGVPCIYYGDEVGLQGMRDPFNRGTFPWGSEDAELHNGIRSLIRFRNQTEALQNGRLRMGAIGQDLFAVLRYSKTETVVLLTNRSDRERNAVLYPALLFEGADANTPVPFDGVYTGLNGECVTAKASLCVSVPKNGFVLLKKQNSEREE